MVIFGTRNKIPDDIDDFGDSKKKQEKPEQISTKANDATKSIDKAEAINDQLGFG